MVRELREASGDVEAKLRIGLNLSHFHPGADQYIFVLPRHYYCRFVPKVWAANLKFLFPK